MCACIDIYIHKKYWLQCMLSKFMMWPTNCKWAIIDACQCETDAIRKDNITLANKLLKVKYFICFINLFSMFLFCYFYWLCYLGITLFVGSVYFVFWSKFFSIIYKDKLHLDFLLRLVFPTVKVHWILSTWNQSHVSFSFCDDNLLFSNYFYNSK